jgi:hypothetical protein
LPEEVPFMTEGQGLGGGAGYCPRVRKVYYDVRLSP